MNPTPLPIIGEWLNLNTPTCLEDALVTGVSTDSRSTRTGDLFIALDGDRFHGSDHLQQALDAGAVAAITPRSDVDDDRVMLVADTTAALGTLAHAYRLTLDCVVVAITGSVGKTTVKEMLRGLLSESFDVVASAKSFNNRIGVPLTLLSADAETEVMIVEVGSNALGEICELSIMARPTMGVITAIASAHLQGLGSIEGVRDEKLSLVAGMAEGTPLFLNADDAILGDVALTSHDIRYFALDSAHAFAPVNAAVSSDHCALHFSDGPPVEAAMGGRHNALNLVASVAVARELGMDADSIRLGAARIVAPSLRNERRSLNGWELVLDCYNANPASMKASLDAFQAGGDSSSARSVFILGDMLELGDSSAELHAALGQQVAKCQCDLLLLIGDEVAHTHRAVLDAGMSASVVHRFTTDQKLDLLDHLCEGDRVLVKGSRGLALEDVFRPQCEGVL